MKTLLFMMISGLAFSAGAFPIEAGGFSQGKRNCMEARTEAQAVGEANADELARKQCEPIGQVAVRQGPFQTSEDYCWAGIASLTVRAEYICQW